MSPWAPTVAVVGAGPAGAATALALARRGVGDVVLVDATPSRAEEARRPAIGESIPPAATPLMRALGVLDEVDCGGHLVCPGNRSLWGGPEPGFNDFMLDPIGKGYHLDRDLFDEQLRAAARSEGVEVLRDARLTEVRRSGDGFELRIDSSGTRIEVTPVMTVDATGAHGAFTRRLPVARNVFDGLVSVCALIESPTGVFTCDYTLLEAAEHGWWYGARLPGDRLIVSFTSDPRTTRDRGMTTPKVWRNALRDTHMMRSEIPDELIERVTELEARAAPVMILSAVVGQGWLAVGDSASAYDPIGSAGITKALGHGIHAAQAIAEHIGADPGDALGGYQDRVFTDFTAHVKLRHELYASEGHWPASPFWAGRRALGRR